MWNFNQAHSVELTGVILGRFVGNPAYDEQLGVTRSFRDFAERVSEVLMEAFAVQLDCERIEQGGVRRSAHAGRHRELGFRRPEVRKYRPEAGDSGLFAHEGAGSADFTSLRAKFSDAGIHSTSSTDVPSIR